MATFEQYLAQLKSDGVRALFFDNNFGNEPLLRVMRYGESADVSEAGRITVTVERQPERGAIDDPVAFGTGLDVDNVYTEPDTFTLAKFGKAFSVDSGLPDTSFQRTADRQLKNSMGRVKDSFLYNFFNGDGIGANPRGLLKFCVDNSLIQPEFDASTALTEAQALAFMEAFNEALGTLNVNPTCVIASRKFTAFLKSVEALVNKSTTRVMYEDIGFAQFNGLPIVEVGNNIIPQVTATTEPYLTAGDEYQFMYIARLDEENGVYAAGPDGNSIIQVSEATKAQAIATGVDTARGFARIVSCPVVNDLHSIVMIPTKVENNA